MYHFNDTYLRNGDGKRTMFMGCWELDLIIIYYNLLLFSLCALMYWLTDMSDLMLLWLSVICRHSTEAVHSVPVMPVGHECLNLTQQGNKLIMWASSIFRC